MKRTITILGLASALALANVRTYTDAPDQTRVGHAITGVVFIVPSVEQCYGLELEHDTNIVSQFGGACE